MHEREPGTPPTRDELPATLSDEHLRNAALPATGTDAHRQRTGTVDPFATRSPEGTPTAHGLHTAGFDLLEEIGRGGMGVVYRARDCRRGQVVALKTMQGVDAPQLLRFKQEFRGLANVVHPNLVALYEMISDGEVWFFTMEYVEGMDFLSHLRPEGPSATVDWTPKRRQQLREAFVQLGEGVQFLHEAGKLHRDLKPRNVLVNPQGRVVILDFGLTVNLDRKGLHESIDRHLLGTIPYMSPEQAATQPLGPASDWYSVGVILFEVLTGRLPFSGEGLQMVFDKQRLDPLSPRDVDPGISEPWNDLCIGLLRRDPLQRLSGPEFLRRLGGAQHSEAAPASSGGRGPLVGRFKPLQTLAEAFNAVERGRPVVCLVSGRSGSGKTTLVQHFLDGLGQAETPLVFTGQCYQQESVPYKAFDGLIDCLSRYLSHARASEVEELLPRDVASLARLFPVLRRLTSTASAHLHVEAPDPRELRRRAFSALRELFSRLGRRRLLVLYIDDLQWGDFDSLALLAELLRPPDPPLMLVIGTYRSEEAVSNPAGSRP